MPEPHSPPSVAPSDSLAEPLGRFVIAFVRAVRTLQLYPSDHPLVKEGIDQVRLEIVSLLGSREELTLAFEDDNVLIEEHVVLRRHASVASLKRYLDEKGVTSFTVGRDVGEADLRRLAEVLAAGDAEVMRDGALDPQIAASFRSIRLSEVAYRRVGPGEESSAAADAPAAATTANRLNETLGFDAFARFEAGDPAGIRALEEGLGENAAAMANGWLSQMRSAVPGFDQPDGDVVEAVVERLERLVSALLERSRFDPERLGAAIDELLAPAGAQVKNDRLKRLFADEQQAPREGRWIRRLSTSTKAAFLLRIALRHAPLVDPVRRAWKALDPDGSGNLLGAALRHVEQAEWPRVQADRATRVLTSVETREGWEDSSSRPEPSAPKKPTPSESRPTAVVCDADPRAAATLERILAREGYDVDSFHDGELALDAILALRPELVVMDPVVSGVHGLEILARLKRLRPVVPVVLTSRHDAFDREYAVTTYPRCAIVRKPIDIKRVRSGLRQLALLGDGTPPVLGPSEFFPAPPVGGPMIGVMRSGPYEVAVGARGTLRNSFFRLVPVGPRQTAIIVAERESGDGDSTTPLREVDRWLHEPNSIVGQAPHEILDRANDRVRRCPEPALLSALALVADAETGTIAVSRAGYPAPLVALPGGASAEMLLPFGPLIGLSSSSAGRTRPLTTRMPIPKGSLVLLHSGGLLEAISPGDPMHGVQILCRCAGNSVDQSAAEAMNSLMALLGGLGVRGPGPDLHVLLFRDVS